MKASLSLLIGCISCLCTTNPLSLFSQPTDPPLFYLYEDTKALVALLERDTIEQDIFFPLGDTVVTERIQRILSKYMVEEERAFPGIRLEFDQLKDRIDQNKFLSTYFGGEGMADNIHVGTSSGSTGGFETTSTPRNSPFPNTAIDGVGRFLAQRFKEELYVTFFERFRERLEDDLILRGLFPQTLEILTYVDSYLYSGRIKMLGGAFEEDMDSLIFNVDRTISNPQIREQLNLDAKGYLAFKSLFFSFSLIKNPSPAYTIRSFTHLPEWEEINPNVASGLKLASILTEGFQSQVNTWVAPNALSVLAKDPTFRRIFLGLLFERVKPLAVYVPQASPVNLDLSGTSSSPPPITYEEISLQDILLDNFESLISGDITWSEEGEELLRGALIDGEDIPASSGPPFLKQEKDLKKMVFNSVRVFNDMVSFLSQLKVSPDSKLAPLVESLEEVGEFTQAVENTAPFAVNFFAHMKAAIQAEGMSGAESNFQDKAYFLGLAFMDLSKIFGGFGNILEDMEAEGGGKPFYKTAEKIFYYGSFVSTVLTTDEAEDVSAIIERFALPSGSARIKREAPFNISINAFAGPSLGWETSSLSKLGFRNEVMLFTAPIGIAASKQLWKTRNGNGASLSLFISALDLGAVTLFRLNDDNQFTSLPAAASFENVFAPGAHLILGFPDVPISAGIGFQRSASLRKITQDEVVFDPNARYRLGMFVGVDIPLFNIYTNTSYTFNRMRFQKKEKKK